MALGMLQESPVDEEDGSSCRRASNLNHNTVLSLALLLIVIVASVSSLGLLSATSPSSSSRLRTYFAALPRQNEPLAVMTSEAKLTPWSMTSRPMDTPSWKNSLTLRVNSPAGVVNVV
ncbi:hypothetical protein BJ912DRAFT_1062787 [Pholiota molesta]|nr:hypothetical protein BJ912DRAFT_1062787 [Pholiota molesta]